jgi:hypothetical protein
LWNMFAFNWISILLFIVPFSFWGMISIRDIKSLYYLRQGRKNYARLLNAPSSPTNENEESIRASNLDDDDKSKPADGAFYSPGYTD